MPNTRGGWTLHAGIKSRWDANNLSALFMEPWGAERLTQKYLALNDSEARAGKPNHPTPYCIYDIDSNPISQGYSSGRAQTAAERIADPTAANGPKNTERQILDYTVEFTIFGSTKSQAIEFAKLVAAAFDKSLLDLEDDEHIETFRLGDFGQRESDSTWSWTLSYRFRIDCAYAAEHS